MVRKKPNLDLPKTKNCQSYYGKQNVSKYNGLLAFVAVIVHRASYARRCKHCLYHGTLLRHVRSDVPFIPQVNHSLDLLFVSRRSRRSRGYGRYLSGGVGGEVNVTILVAVPEVLEARILPSLKRWGETSFFAHRDESGQGVIEKSDDSTSSEAPLGIFSRKLVSHIPARCKNTPPSPRQLLSSCVCAAVKREVLVLRTQAKRVCTQRRRDGV